MLAENYLKIQLSTTNEERKSHKEKRLERIKEAIKYESGQDQATKKFHTLWSRDGYEVAVGKPGKEAAENYNNCRYKDGHSGNNPNDMYPAVFLNGSEIVGIMKTFEEVFEGLFSLKKHDRALELIACLLFRSAFMIDHSMDDKGYWRYRPSIEIIDLIKSEVSTIKGLPVWVFLHYLDAIGLNEDVKYHTLGYEIGLGYGRRNNILTCVNLIAVLLERFPITKFAGTFARPPAGVSPISTKKALEIFPYLQPIEEVS
jgi:hypothetical protein